MSAGRRRRFTLLRPLYAERPPGLSRPKSALEVICVDIGRSIKHKETAGLPCRGNRLAPSDAALMRTRVLVWTARVRLSCLVRTQEDTMRSAI